MLRNVSLEEISDGRLYGANDMVKADCADCKGCSACCRGMGSSIVLDPLDVCRLVNGLGEAFEVLLQKNLELNVVDGMILPNLKMTGGEECCAFLNQEGRCTIHAFRPGICRLFPLGRYYEENVSGEEGARPFRYFLQIHECKNKNRTKVKVRKWIDTPDFEKYEQFVAAWHALLKDFQKLIVNEQGLDEAKAKEISLYVLREFYFKPFAQESFYGGFALRVAAARESYHC